MDNHAKITKPILIAAGLLLTVVSFSSQFFGSALAQTAAGTCTQSGIHITCNGTVSGLTQGVFQSPPGQCPTSHSQSSQARCTTVEEETGVADVSIPVTVTSSCNNQHGPVPPFITTTTTTLSGNSDLVSGGFVVKNPGGQITNTVPGTSTFSIIMDTRSISTQLPNCPTGLNPAVDITNVGTPMFGVVPA